MFRGACLFASFSIASTQTTCSDLTVNGQAWNDADGTMYNCQWYETTLDACRNHGDSFRNTYTANEACCACGGGSTALESTPSPSPSPSLSSSSLSTICTDVPYWYDSGGPNYNCAWYAESGSNCQVHGSSFENFGHTASTACCVCGGGSTSVGPTGPTFGPTSSNDFRNGEEVCEGHGFDQNTCLSISCCDWDDGQCWSKVGTDMCFNDENDFDQCYGYITGRNTYTPNVKPKPRQCTLQNPDSIYYNEYSSNYFPETYHDMSCCSSEGAYSTIQNSNGLFRAGYESPYPTGQCVAMVEMMNLMICNPNQGLYVDKEKNSLRICKQTCDAWYDECNGFLYGGNSYSDGTSLCHFMWSGKKSSEAMPSCEYEDNFLCEAELTLDVVENNQDCLYVKMPSERLVKHYESMYQYNVSEFVEYPSACTEEEKEKRDWKGILIKVGIGVGAVVGCLCASGGAYLLYYYLCSSKNNGPDFSKPADPWSNQIQEVPVETAVTPSTSNIGINADDYAAIQPCAPPQPSAPVFEFNSAVPVPVEEPEIDLSQGVGPAKVETTSNIQKPTSFQQESKPEPEPEPELSFIQRLDMRDLDFKKEMGSITEEEYQRQRHKVIYG